MPRVIRAILAVMLAALWLPATAHCSLGAATEWFAESCDLACSHDGDSEHLDACVLIEDGGYRVGSSVAHAPAPSLGVLTCLACLHARLLEVSTPLAPPAWAMEHPRDWLPAWNFEVRAALPARAPDLT